MDGEGDIKGIRRVVGGERKPGFKDRGLLVEDGGGEWDFHPIVGEGQRSDSSIMQVLSELFGRDRTCSSDEGSGGAVREAGVAKGCRGGDDGALQRG